MIEITRNPDGSIDEVSAQDVSIHIEDMGQGNWHVLIYQGDGKEVYWQFSLGEQGLLVESGDDDT